MSKKYGIFITCLFLVFLVGFMAANAATPDREFSDTENRVLQQLPELKLGALTASGANNVLSGEFMEDFETYVADQFALRDQWVALKAGTEAALGKQENNGVYLGSRDTLIAKFAGPVTKREVLRCEQNYGYVDALAGNVQVPVYFTLIPGKVSVWADRLPLGAPNADENVYIAKGAQVSAAWWIDVAAAMNAHKDEEIYYRTDHHWTSLGAYYTYAALMEGMGITPVPLSRYTKTTVSDQFYGTTFASSGVRWVEPDCLDIYVPQESATVDNYPGEANFDPAGRPIDPEAGSLYDMSTPNKYTLYLGGNRPLTVVKSTVAPEGAPKLLLIRDSYADSMVPFLTAHFSEVHMWDPRYYRESVSQYVSREGIDQVLVMYSVSNFVTDGNLFVLGM